MAESYMRGHKIEYSWNIKKWIYQDNGCIADDSRPCSKCNRLPTKEGYDACLKYVKGIQSACCGHGVHEPIWLKKKQR